jgi:hypothetical protein
MRAALFAAVIMDRGKMPRHYREAVILAAINR